MFGWSADSSIYLLAVIRGMGRLTTVWDLWLSGSCTGIPVIDPGFNPRRKSHSIFLLWHVFHQHLTDQVNYYYKNINNIGNSMLQILYMYMYHVPCFSTGSLLREHWPVIEIGQRLLCEVHVTCTGK